MRVEVSGLFVGGASSTFAETGLVALFRWYILSSSSGTRLKNVNSKCLLLGYCYSHLESADAVAKVLVRPLGAGDSFNIAETRARMLKRYAIFITP